MVFLNLVRENYSKPMASTAADTKIPNQTLLLLSGKGEGTGAEVVPVHLPLPLTFIFK